MKKRILSWLLVIVMLAAMLPTISLTADATEYASGQTVRFKSLKEGDILRKDSCITANGFIVTIKKTSSPTTANGKEITTLFANKSWTVDRNYYVVESSVTGSDLYIYPIPDSPITFSPNGGTLNGNTGPQTFQAMRFTSDYYDVSWLNPYKPGCTFLGWYTDDGKTQVYDAKGYAVNCSLWSNNIYQGEGAKSLIAKWQVNTSVTFRYYPNGGTGVNQTLSDNYVQWYAPADYFESYSSDSHWNYTSGNYKLTRTGYTATGYFAKKDGSCLVHEDEAFTSYTQLCNAYGLNPDSCGNAVIDIYAQWKANTYQIVFNGNGNTGGSTASQNFAYDTAQNLRANGFQQAYTVTFDPGEGSTATSGIATSAFKGWNTKADGSGTAYASQQSVKNLTVTDGATINLYAQWTPGSVTLPTPTKSGKVCTGWFTSSGTKVGDCGGSYTPTGNTTLYAKWETAGYTVIWKNYDGTTLETDEGVAQGTTPTYDGDTPTKPDTTDHSYIFSGWSPAISPVTGNVEYTAQFTETPRQYALNFLFDESKGELGGNEKAAVGSVVTVNVLPNNGYGVKAITAYKTGDKNTTVSIDSTSYTFTMPAFDVTIEVTWVESDVIYTSAYKDVAPTFTVTIPATVELGNQITISAENVRVNKGLQIVVSIADASGIGNAFTMTSAAGNSFAYCITANGNAISSGANILTVNPDTNSAGTVTLKFEKPKKAIYAGNYTGSVTFTIAVNPAENN